MSQPSPMNMAEAFIRFGEFDDALQVLNAHLEANPADDEARRLRAGVLMRLPLIESQQQALTDLDALVTPTADDFVQRSVIWQQQGDWPTANAAMQHAHTLQPHDERILERYLFTLENVGDDNQISTLLAQVPRTWRWLQLAGDHALRQVAYPTAIDHYTSALHDLDTRMDTQANPISRALRGTLLSKRGQAYLLHQSYTQAIADLMETAVIFPKDLSYALLHAIALTLSGNTDAGRDLAQQVLRDETSLMDLLREWQQREPALRDLPG
jgi:tetratricopeptide (TPR) repeat protein